MTPRWKRILSAAALAFVCALGWTVYGQKQTPRHKAAWEYKVVRSLSEEQLNQLGAEGWELVAATVHEGQASQYLKRPR